MPRNRPSYFPMGRVLATTAPDLLGSALTSQREGEGTANFSAALSVGTANVTLIGILGIRTALFGGPLTGNNGNTYDSSALFNVPYGNGFGTYSLRGWRAYGASGSSNHAVSGTKSGGNSEETTVAIVGLSGGQVRSSNALARVANGAGATHTSGSVSTDGPARLISITSGDGNVNATPPSQTYPGDWSVLHAYAEGTGTAPNGHIPLYIATKVVSIAGSYTVQVQTTLDEGLTMVLLAVW